MMKPIGKLKVIKKGERGKAIDFPSIARPQKVNEGAAVSVKRWIAEFRQGTEDEARWASDRAARFRKGLPVDI